MQTKKGSTGAEGCGTASSCRGDQARGRSEQSRGLWTLPCAIRTQQPLNARTHCGFGFDDGAAEGVCMQRSVEWILGAGRPRVASAATFRACVCQRQARCCVDRRDEPHQEKCEARNAADDGKVSAVRVFTDGAAELLDGWPHIATAVEWAAAFLQRQSVGGSGDSQAPLSEQ